jgi:hypothetical protein
MSDADTELVADGWSVVTMVHPDERSCVSECDGDELERHGDGHSTPAAANIDNNFDTSARSKSTSSNTLRAS